MSVPNITGIEVVGNTVNFTGSGFLSDIAGTINSRSMQVLENSDSLVGGANFSAPGFIGGNGLNVGEGGLTVSPVTVTTGGFYVSGWIDLSDVDSWRTIYELSLGTGLVPKIKVLLEPPGKLRLDIVETHSVSYKQITTDAPLSLGRQHIALYWDGSDNSDCITIWINRAQQASTFFINETLGPLPTFNFENIGLSSTETVPFNNGVYGVIHNWMFGSVALTGQLLKNQVPIIKIDGVEQDISKWINFSSDATTFSLDYGATPPDSFTVTIENSDGVSDTFNYSITTPTVSNLTLNNGVLTITGENLQSEMEGVINSRHLQSLQNSDSLVGNANFSANGLELDGVIDGLNISPVTVNTGKFYIVTIINLNALVNDYHTIYEASLGTGDVPKIKITLAKSTGTLTFVVTNTAFSLDKSITTSFGFPLGLHLVAFSWDGTNNADCLKIWIDGLDTGSTMGVNDSFTSIPQFDTEYIGINSSLENSFDGVIQDWYFGNVILTEEILRAQIPVININEVTLENIDWVSLNENSISFNYNETLPESSSVTVQGVSGFSDSFSLDSYHLINENQWVLKVEAYSEYVSTIERTKLSITTDNTDVSVYRYTILNTFGDEQKMDYIIHEPTQSIAVVYFNEFWKPEIFKNDVIGLDGLDILSIGELCRGQGIIPLETTKISDGIRKRIDILCVELIGKYTEIKTQTFSFYKDGEGDYCMSIVDFQSIPVGTVVEFCGSINPTGWVDADGSTLLQVDHPDLYTTMSGTGLDFVAPNKGAGYIVYSGS